MRSRILAVLLSTTAFTALAGTTTARALYTARPTANVAETVVVGMIDITADDNCAFGTCVGIGVRVPVACFDAPGSTNDRYFALGDIAAPFGLDDNTVVYGDPTTGTSNDSMYLIETNGTSVGGYCQNATDFSGTWNRMTYNGYYLDLHGVGGGDTLQDGGGSGDTYLYGEAGGDLLIQSSSIGSAKGGDDNDFVLGFSSGAGDDLSGGNGIDCLYDTTNTAALFSCGGTAGDTRDSRNSGAYISGCPASGTCW